MNEPEFDKHDPVWKALDAFEGIEPHPQSRARFWASVARSEGTRSAGWLFRFALPGAALACVILTIVVGARIHERNEEDLEIAADLELYENLEMIQNMPQLASYEEPTDEDFDELLK